MTNDTRGAVARLAGWVAGLHWGNIPASVRESLLLTLLDTAGVTAAGNRLPENRALAQTWPLPEGPAPLIGGGQRTTADTAAWLNGVAAVSLELDEGNKYAGGHPASHGFPAVLAAASTLQVTGAEVCTALLAAYEVAARFGRATRLHPDLHPHGNWGVAGAAAGVARLLGLRAERVAAAMDAATGLPIAGHFDSAPTGNLVRNAWVGTSNLSGFLATRMASAGVAQNTGTAAYSLGHLIGTIDPGKLTTSLGSHWYIRCNYYKRHASCSFTHPPADAALALREEHPAVREAMTSDAIHSVKVETHSQAARLTRLVWPSRLAAMFSIPYVVATALLHGRLGPTEFSCHHRQDPAIQALANRISVQAAEDLDARRIIQKSLRSL